MALTALDIQQQRFRTKVRGIDPKEVQTFLEQAAAAFEDLQRETSPPDRRASGSCGAKSRSTANGRAPSSAP